MGMVPQQGLTIYSPFPKNIIKFICRDIVSVFFISNVLIFWLLTVPFIEIDLISVQNFV